MTKRPDGGRSALLAGAGLGGVIYGLTALPISGCARHRAVRLGRPPGPAGRAAATLRWGRGAAAPGSHSSTSVPGSCVDFRFGAVAIVILAATPILVRAAPNVWATGVAAAAPRDPERPLSRLPLVGHSRRMAIYYAWSRQAETSAPLGVIENRFPALFEIRRILYPRFSELSDPARYDQGIGGHLDHIQRQSFAAFSELASSLTNTPVIEVERADSDGTVTPITGVLDAGVDTLVVISLDSLRTEQRASEDETAAIERSTSDDGNLMGRPQTGYVMCSSLGELDH